jgi:ADP-ribosylglycohydrolase
MTLPTDHSARMDRALLSLDGISVGDAFGEHFFTPLAQFLIGQRAIPFPRWRYTDDTEMALGIVEVLQRHGRIDREDLAHTFARRYFRHPQRGYGATAHEILQAIGRGVPWSEASAAAFGGEGSMGNGAAMRVGPLGAYFADDLDRVVSEAAASAEVTHAHPEGKAGAIAVAVAAAWAWRIGAAVEHLKPDRLFEIVLQHTPAGETWQGVERARELDLEASVLETAQLLGSGQRVTAPDTVPFTIWCAARHLDNYQEAMWNTVAGLGDRDTTCAIVGGIVVLSAGRESIPADWLEAREPLELAT